MFVRNRQQLVVNCYSPHKARMLWAALLVALVALAWSVWVYAPSRVSAGAGEFEAQALELRGKLASSEAERSRLEAAVARHERMAEVGRQAYSTLQQDFDTLQRQTLGLREQLAFYQRVTSPTDAAGAGVRIQRFLLKPDGTEGGFLYTLVLVQSRENKRTVSGTLRFTISGTQNDERQKLELVQVSEPPVNEIDVGFRYFQDLSGSIRLPPGFRPERLDVQVELKRPRREITKSYSWDKLQS